MALKVDVDYALSVMREAGHSQTVTVEDMYRNSAGADPTTDGKTFWFPAANSAMCLRPLQLDEAWLNTSQQLDSIIGLAERGSGILQGNTADITDSKLFEASIRQNPDNPFVFHAPVTPLTALNPSPPAGVTGQLDIEAINDSSSVSLSVFGAPSFPGPPGSHGGDLKIIAYTAADQEWNQGFLFRFYQLPSELQHLSTYGFLVGNFAVMAHGTIVEVHVDISPNKDRTAWRRIMASPLFAPGTARQPDGTLSTAANTQGPFNAEGHVRSLLWFPFRRHHVFIQTSYGHWRVFPTRTFPKLNGKEGTAEDWDIVSPKKVAVGVLSPGVGCFQIQRLKFPSGIHTVNVEPFKIEYTPADPLTVNNVVPDYDAKRGTTLAWTIPTTAFGYDPPVNQMDTCVNVPDDPTDLSRTYGFQFQFSAPDNQRWTPFLYGYDLRVNSEVGTWNRAGLTVSDNPADGLARIQKARYSSSLKPGEAELEIDIMDFPPFQAGSVYYRGDAPVRLWRDNDAPTADDVLFIGMTTPNQVEPLRWDNAAPRRFNLHAADLWKLLKDSYPRAQRDWGPTLENGRVQPGVGHITVVDFIARQCGINTTGADYPGGGPDGTFDFPLGGNTVTAELSSEDLEPGWKPKATESAADFIELIAKNFSGWDVGFYPDGQFYYRPKDFYKSPVVLFRKNRADGAGPLYRSPVTFRNESPEFNTFQLFAEDAGSGKSLASSVFVDRASILNPLAPNFLGRRKANAAFVRGAWTCSQLNHMARTVWNTGRRRHLIAKVEAEYVVGLKVGRPVVLHGLPGYYRVISYEVEWQRTGWSPATYELEFVERGSF